MVLISSRARFSRDKRGRYTTHRGRKRRRDHSKDKRKRSTSSKTTTNASLKTTATTPVNAVDASGDGSGDRPSSLSVEDELDDVIVVSRLPVDSDDDDEESNEGGSTSNLLDPSSNKSYSLVGTRRRTETPR